MHKLLLVTLLMILLGMGCSKLLTSLVLHIDLSSVACLPDKRHFFPFDSTNESYKLSPCLFVV